MIAFKKKCCLDYQNAPNTRKRSAAGDGAGSSSEVDYEGGPSSVGGGADLPDTGAEETASPAKRTRSCEKEEQAEEEEGGFRCAPCGFSTPDRSEFQQHILKHRDSESASQQCVQCGACFASAASLSRHRFITHKLRQDQQDSLHTSHTPKPGEEEKGEDEGEGNMSCRVCGRRFDKASDLNTHFRTHGMAFISAHKTDKVV